jgi:hypothetical protein
VAVAFGHRRSGGEWAITSGILAPAEVDGPHFVAVKALHPAPSQGMLRFEVSNVLNPNILYDRLERQIADLRVRHQSVTDWRAFLFGRLRTDRVTCSSLIGRAILEQHQSPLALALRDSLRRSPHWRRSPDIYPTDIARALAYLEIPAKPEPDSRVISTPIPNQFERQNQFSEELVDADRH